MLYSVVAAKPLSQSNMELKNKVAITIIMAIVTLERYYNVHCSTTFVI
jgi:hypothetical protein